MTALFARLPDVALGGSGGARVMDDCLSAAQAANCHQAVALYRPLVIFAWLVEGSPFLCRLLKNYPDVLDALADTPDYLERQLAENRRRWKRRLARCGHGDIAPRRNRLAWPLRWPIAPMAGMSRRRRAHPLCR